MKIAFFTPLNPVQSGISDYSEELLLALHGARMDGTPARFDIFIERGYRPSNPEILSRFRVEQGRAFGRVAHTYDLALYQMGNSPAHAYMYEELLRRGGVVVMHEFVLHHLRMWMALNGGKRKAYLALMEQRYGAEGREAARRVMLGQFPEALFNYPLSDEVINRAQGIIVHSNYMAGLVRGVRPDVPLSVVPMGVPLPPLIPKQEARRRLGLDPDLFLITSVGHLNPYKRVSATLRAYKALLMEVPRSLYVLVGSRSPNYDPTRQIRMLGLEDKVKITGYASPEEFALYLAASDVCLNLRYPTAGETSASLLRIMGAGVPVLVSRTGSFEELPDDAAGKIDVSDIEEDLLLEYLLLLARMPDLRAAMSAAARRYVAEHHTLEGAAQGYLQFLHLLSKGGYAEATLSPASPALASRQEPASQVNGAPAPLPLLAPAAGGVDGLAEGPHATGGGEDAGGGGTSEFEPTGVVAQAAAEVGVEEGDELVLAHLAQRVSEIL